jgi:ATP-dependent Clp protease adapter protein ClpS
LHGDPVDKQVTPKDAVNALGIADQKKNLVVYYLETFFGLTEKEAWSVVQEAHAASN